MSMDDSRRTLFEWYDKYVGEATSRREVYGYWLFVLGYVIGISGVLVFLLGPGGPESSLFFQLREIAIVLSAVGLGFGMLGIALQLPVSRLGVVAASLGGLVALLGVAYFVSVYPDNWLGPESPQRTVIAIYVAGVALIAGVAVLVPVLTGQRSFLRGRDIDDESRAIMVGEAELGGLFAVFRNGPADWRWRLLEQEALADGVAGFASRPDVESAVEHLRETVTEAGFLEINTAAFRLYGGSGTWQWDLLTEAGATLATSTHAFGDRDDAVESVNVLKEFGPDATLLEIQDAAFQLTREGTGWSWRLLDDTWEELAAAPTRYDDEATAESSRDAFRAAAGTADLLAIEDVGFEIIETESGWSWRLVDDTDDELAAATETFEERAHAREHVDNLRDGIDSAPIVTQTEAHFELVAETAGWSWRFVDGDADVQVHSIETGDRAECEEIIDTFAANAPAAGIVEGRDDAVELYQASDGWRWRLVDPERQVIQQSTGAYPDKEAAQEALEHAIKQTQDAELVEFEEAAFQLYEAESGDWRWRLIEEGGEVLADSGEDYDTRDAAAAGMTTLKEHAPEAELLEIDSAAIELFRENDEWGWRVVDEEGETVAESGQRHPSKNLAKSATESMRETFVSAGQREIDEGAFQVFERTDENAGWHWQYVAADGAILAQNADARTTREGIERAVETVRSMVNGAERHAIDRYAFELYPDRSGWKWRVIDRDREAIAESSREYDDTGETSEMVERIRSGAAAGEVFELTNPVYRIREAAAGWTWDLVDEDRTRLAEGVGHQEEAAGAEAVTETVADVAPNADELSYDNAAFELLEEDTGWGWRLIDEAERPLAESPRQYETRQATLDALETLRAVVNGASILEIERASFELHETEDQAGWEWRLVDESGDLLARSVKTYESRTAAREGMGTLKEHAPEAGVVVAG